MDQMNPFVSMLRKSGHRITHQRLPVWETVIQQGGHITLEEVHQYMAARHQPIHLSTLYRTLNFLCEVRLLTAADIGCGKIVYESSGLVPHHHLVCRTCGKIIQISHAEVEKFFTEIYENHAYQIDMDHLTLFGLCPDCQAKP
jgi:Fur family transcriptional regulator, ferric uptake regulator